jgi:hypothetical protein
MKTEHHTAERPVIDQKIREEIKKFLEFSEYENATYQNLGDTAKALLRGKFIVITAYDKKLRPLK